MATITFFPVGNADTSLICLANSQLILVDYANMRDANNQNDKRCDLPLELKNKLAKHKQADFRVVCFSHLDNDHVKGMGDFFWLEHAKKYQIDGRPRIQELWVPAAAITEEGADDDARIVRQEARYRLREGKGVKVFSRPEALKSFLEKEDLTIEKRKECIVDAGTIVDGFSLDKDERVEFFAHSPFAWRVDDQKIEDRNQNSIVFQATFIESGIETRAIFGGDVDSETLSEIVKTTKRHKNEIRLAWDILKLFHHCSYKAIDSESSDPEAPLVPIEEVKWLIETQGQTGCVIISPSDVLPEKNKKGDNPPHIRAAKYYKKIIGNKDGEFKVTMEHPTKSSPKLIEVSIDSRGASVIATIGTSIGTATSIPTRAG
ncbi:hypothetical protein LJC71_00320 [Desulfosarcina sp. OttesenSCG-928-A07]|nr:hypothetical protein [Desulfosarcina sp. OttesenSCG-928-A07]